MELKNSSGWLDGEHETRTCVGRWRWTEFWSMALAADDLRASVWSRAVKEMGSRKAATIWVAEVRGYEWWRGLIEVHGFWGCQSAWMDP